ncbi:MAG: restriction endonuclease subunit S [Thermoleophilia bacterium]|nr:restriction endonuclease subunit S [Thermoleophilia bacterium]
MSLNDVAEIAPAGTFDPKTEPRTPYLGLEHLETGKRTPAGWGSSDETASLKTRFRAGDVLFGKLRPYLRKVAVADHDGVCSTEVLVLRPRDALVTREFLYCVCASSELAAYAVGHSAGTRMPRISPSLLLRARVPLPPIDEQRRIADVLKSMDDAIAARRSVALQLERLLSVSRNAALDAISDVNVLGDLIRAIGVGESPRCLDRLPQDGEWGVLKISAVRPTSFDPTQVKTLPKGVTPKVRARLADGDLLMTRSNTLDRVGAACVATGNVHHLLLSDLVFRIELDQDRMLHQFAAEALSSRRVRDQIEAAAVGTSGSMQKVNQRIIRSLEVPLPSIEAQRGVLVRLQAIKQSLAATSLAAGALTDSRVALLRALLSGAHGIPASYDRFLAEDGAEIESEPAIV